MLKEEDRKCIHCESTFEIIYLAVLGKPDLCPFCGGETELDEYEEKVYKEEEEE